MDDNNYLHSFETILKKVQLWEPICEVCFENYAEFLNSSNQMICKDCCGIYDDDDDDDLNKDTEGAK